MRRKIVLLLSFLALILVADRATVGLAHITRRARPSAQVQIYHYDFESGTNHWQLDSGIWVWAPSPEGGHALRGTGHGFARLTAHTGEVSLLRFRFRLDRLQSRMHANILESFAAGHTRYIVAFGSDGVKISRQQGASFQELGLGFVPIAPNVFHETQIMVGGGSLDVFLDGEEAVGVDDPTPPPPGQVSFESLESSVAYVDDVMVQMGPEPAPHPKAPRPPLNLPPGPDVGPFVGGVHTGDIVLTGNNVLNLSQGRYTLKAGHIKLSGSARLRIGPGAVLVFDRGTSPLIHWGVDLMDASVMEVDGGAILAASGTLVRIHAFGTSQLTILDSKPWIHFINAGGNATVSVSDSRFVTSIGGSIQLSGNASIRIWNSRVGAIALFIPAGSRFDAGGLRPGFFSSFDLQRDMGVFNIGYNLQMSQVEIVADTLDEGPYERGWVIFADETARARIMDSTLRKFVFSLSGAGPERMASGLRLNRSTNLQVGDVELYNVTVTGQWGFFLYGTRRAVLDDCKGLWVWLEDNAELLMRNSTMNEFDTRRYRGTLTFDDSEWQMTGEIIEQNDLLMRGTVKIDPDLRQSLSWSQSVVTRRLPILVLNASGAPIPGATITLTRGGQVITATTGPTGEASVGLRFTDQDYRQPWQLTTSAGHLPLSVDFFTSTPIIVREFPTSASNQTEAEINAALDIQLPCRVPEPKTKQRRMEP